MGIHRKHNKMNYNQQRWQMKMKWKTIRNQDNNVCISYPLVCNRLLSLLLVVVVGWLSMVMVTVNLNQKNKG